MSHEEIEAKYLNINPAELEKKLAAIGAKRVGEMFYIAHSFDYPDWRLDKEHSWLRLRTDGKETTLTFKKRIGVKASGGQANDDGMEEVEVKVDDFEKTKLIIHKLGFVDKRYMEKKRIRWEKDGVEYDIDFWPELKPYLEIEADSWERVDKAALELGLDLADKKVFSASQAYSVGGINVNEYSRLAFDGLVKRTK